MASKGMNVSGASQVTDEKDPCADEARLSMKCLNDNGFDKNACRVHFENYKACKTFWMKVRMMRRMNGIYPALPPLVERVQMKKLYLETGAKKIPVTPDG